jgi:hypothetical protein
MGLRPTTH